jgi:hypothetical protein
MTILHKECLTGCNGLQLDISKPIATCDDIPDAQTLSISGNNLSISGGNTIALPAAPGETVTTMTNVLGTGTVVGTYTNEAGTAVDIRVPASPDKMFVKQTWTSNDNTTNINVNDTVIDGSEGSISLTNPYTYNITVVERSYLLEGSATNVGWAGWSNPGQNELGFKPQRSLTGSAGPWVINSPASYTGVAAPPIGTLNQIFGPVSTHIHVIAPGATLTVNYRTLRVVQAGANGQAVSVGGGLSGMFFESTLQQL